MRESTYSTKEKFRSMDGNTYVPTMGKNNICTHAMRIEMHLCCHARMDGCPFAYSIVVETHEISVKQTFCFWGFRTSGGEKCYKGYSPNHFSPE